MVTATRGRLKVATRAAPNTSAGSARLALPGAPTATRIVMVSFLLPRRALEIQPYRVVGQRVIQNDGLMTRGQGRGTRGESQTLAPRPCSSLAPRHVLVLARLDTRAAVARILSARLVQRWPRSGG